MLWHSAHASRLNRITATVYVIRNQTESNTRTKTEAIGIVHKSLIVTEWSNIRHN